MKKAIHWNNNIESNKLACGALKEPEELVFRLDEISLYSDIVSEVTCKKCIRHLTTSSSGSSTTA